MEATHMKTCNRLQAKMVEDLKEVCGLNGIKFTMRWMHSVCCGFAIRLTPSGKSKALNSHIPRWNSTHLRLLRKHAINCGFTSAFGHEITPVPEEIDWMSTGEEFYFPQDSYTLDERDPTPFFEEELQDGY
jgi:hypothetical protein